MVVAASFLIFLLAILVRSVPAMHYITLDTIRLVSNGALWAYAWFGWELIGEIGLVIRIAGAAFFLAFSLALLREGAFSLAYIRRGVLFEGVYYVFNLPATIFLFIAAPQIAAGYIAGIGAAVSFTVQMLIVTPIFLKFYFKLKNPIADLRETKRWTALAIIGFVFALWFKHFMLGLYAMPLKFSPVIVVGFLNSVVTLLAAALLMVVAFLPWIKKQKMPFNSKLLGVALCLMGLYSVVFVVCSFLEADYLRWFNLIDLWLITLPILGFGILRKKGVWGKAG